MYLVDDDKNIRKSLQLSFKDSLFELKVFHSSVSALSEIGTKEPDILVLDIQIDDLTGIDIYNKLLSEGYEIPVIFISGHASLTLAVQGVKLGAFDFIEKPFAPEKLLQTLNNCIQFTKIKSENEFYKKYSSNDDFIGNSKAFTNVIHEIQKVAPSMSSVLITGESGTGKELIAKEIHRQSKRYLAPFIKVNCSAIPENLFESEFFGYTKGAFTGADRNKKGFFELADKGTIFLDEIGELSLSSQAKLLRVLQNQEVQKLGSENIIPVSFRLISATNKHLKSEVNKGHFREDLFYRITTFPLHSPPLRERPEDIPLLSYFFLRQFLNLNELPSKQISSEAMDKLCHYSWPGNIRELKNVIERMGILGGQLLDVSLLHFLEENSRSKQIGTDLSLKDFRNFTEREYIIKILKQCKGNISAASQILDIERTYLHRKIQDFSIQKKEYF